MDEFKPEDELKPDPSDRPARNRKPNGDNEPQINFDDFDLDEDDTRSTRSRRGRENDEADIEEARSETASRRPRKRKGAPQGPISRQHLMMALGILVLLLLIFGIGSALNTPTTVNAPGADDRSAGRSIDLSGNSETAANQANGAQPQPGTTSAANPAAPQEITLPEVSSTPTQGQVSPGPDNQQRVEVQGNLNNALTQQQGQFDNAASKTTLPTEPATVAPVNGSSAPRQAAKNDRTASNKTTPTKERQRAVIEPTRKTESNRSRPQATAASSETKATATRPAAPAASAAASKTSSSSPAATGNIGMLTSAPGNHYTLQLSSSSNYNNLNAWAKKEKLNNAVIYKTTRNGQPWYVLVNGVYASRDEARRAVTSLPADVQAKNPWTKPINQVQADLKQ